MATTLGIHEKNVEVFTNDEGEVEFTVTTDSVADSRAAVDRLNNSHVVTEIAENLKEDGVELLNVNPNGDIKQVVDVSVVTFNT